MISLEMYNGWIAVICHDPVIRKDLYDFLSIVPWAKESGDIYIVNPFYVNELSKALGPWKEYLAVSQGVRDHKASFNEMCVDVFSGKGKYTSEKYRGSIATVDVYPNFSKVRSGLTDDKALSNKMQFFFKPAVNMKKYKDGRWDGMIRLYDSKSRTFPTGLLFIFKEQMQKIGMPYRITYRYERRPARRFNWYVDDGIIPDPDQIEAVEMAWRAGRSVVKAPTGFGKTAILAKRLTAKFAVRTLFLANRKSLLDDARDEFVKGIANLEAHEVGEIKDGIFGAKGHEGPLRFKVIVATIQSLKARLDDGSTRETLEKWLKGVEFLMVDETQAVGSDVWDEVLDKIYAPYRAFLSATPKRTDGATLKIFARSGDVSFTTTAEEQIKKGRLSEVEIIYKIFDHKLYNQKAEGIVFSDAYRNWIVENDERTALVVDEAMAMVKEGRHVLILFQFIDHGQKIFEAMLNAGLTRDEVRFVYGETPNKARQAAIKEFRKGEFKVLIGSTIFDAGVNIPIISGIVAAGAGNSEITLVQRIGRAVRTADYEEILGELPDFMKHADGKVAKVVDIYDANIIFFEKQARKRYNIAGEEFGKSRVKVVGERSAPEKINLDDRDIDFEVEMDKFVGQMSIDEVLKSASAYDEKTYDELNDFINAMRG